MDAFTAVPRAPADGERGPGGDGARDGARDRADPRDGPAASTLPRSHRAKPARRRPRRKRSFWRELPVLVVIAITLALIIKTYAMQAFFIPSGSMQNTLAINDRVLVNKIVYHVRGIARGDIVVFNGDGSWNIGSSGPSNPLIRFGDALEGIVGVTSDSNIYIKRVIGLPGDHVACCNLHGQVTVNGVPLTEGSYLYPGNMPSQTRFSIVVPAGRLWVMGDHRDISYDSRGHVGDPGGGTIPESAVVGRAFMIIWPPSRMTLLNIPATFGQPKLSASTAAQLSAALDAAGPVQVRSAGSPLPLALGLGGAVPLTWLQRRARGRIARRWSRRGGGGSATEGRSRSVSGLSGANRRRPAVWWRTLRSDGPAWVHAAPGRRARRVRERSSTGRADTGRGHR